MTETRTSGRPRSIDRDRLLDAAEEIVVRGGAAALTIDAVAKATGVTKGGVQYAFGTKEALVRAMFARWDESYDRAIAAMTEAEPGSRESLAAHVEFTRRSDPADNAKSAALLAAMVRSPEHLAETRAWYRSRIAGLDLTKPADRRARLAFMATEGVFMLRFFGLMSMDEAEWDDVLDDVATLVSGPERSQPE